MILKRKLKRDVLVKIVDEFSSNYKKEEDDLKKKDLIENMLNDLENTLLKNNCEYDKRFVTYCRRDFLRKEFTSRLNKENIDNYNDYLIDAFYDLYDYIVCDVWIQLSFIPKELDAKEIITEDDNYKKDGIICEQEKDKIIKMIHKNKITGKRYNFSEKFHKLDFKI